MSINNTFNSLSSRPFISTGANFILTRTYDNSPETDDFFGGAVAVSNDANFLLIGAPEYASQQGIAYFYSKSIATKYIQVDSETGASFANSALGFGTRISTDNSANWTIIAPESFATRIEYVKIMQRSGNSFSLNTTLYDPTGNLVPSQRFGSTIAITGDGNYAAIGDFNLNKVYIYERTINTWSLLSNISNVSALSLEFNSNGNILLIGEETAGEVYIHKKSGNTWPLDQTLTANDATANNFFGTNIQISSDDQTIVVGSPGADSNAGAVYIFDYDSGNTTYVQDSKLIASDANTDTRLGSNDYGLSISNNANIIVASSRTSLNLGNVYIFEKINNTYTQTEKLSSPGNSVTYGYAISLNGDGNTLFVSNPGDDTFDGVVYQYNKT